MTPTATPLAGLRVVALEQAVAAPLCSRHLADLGADVIKVERVDGGDFSRDYDTYVDGMSSHFVWLNRNKRSLALDLKSEQGKGILLRLLERADVLLSNLAPGALDRLVADEEIAARNPALIRCAISGYGPAGPYQHRKAFDLLVQGEAGVTANTGDPGHPAKPGVSLADLGGGIYATASILAALHQRHATGRGAKLHIAMFDVLVEWMTPLLLAHTEGGVGIEPAGTRHATITPYGPFPTASGPPVNIAVQNERQWVALCAALGETAMAADPRLRRNDGRLRHRATVEASIARATGRLSAATHRRSRHRRRPVGDAQRSTGAGRTPPAGRGGPVDRGRVARRRAGARPRFALPLRTVSPTRRGDRADPARPGPRRAHPGDLGGPRLRRSRDRRPCRPGRRGGRSRSAVGGLTP